MRNNKGWYNEPLRHSLARKGVKTGRKLRKKTTKRFVKSDLTSKELASLQKAQIKSLQEGKIFSSDDYIKYRNKQLVKQYENRYKQLATGKAERIERNFYLDFENDEVVDKIERSKAKNELEEYRRDKADYLQFVDENKKIEDFNKKYSKTSKGVKSQKLTEQIFEELKKDNPRVYDWAVSHPEYKLFVVEDVDFGDLVEQVSGQRPVFHVQGIHNAENKTIVIKTRLDKPTPSSRAQLKEVIVHEYSHAINRENEKENHAREWKNTIKPALKEEWNLLKNVLLGRISGDDFGKRKRLIDFKMSRATSMKSGGFSEVGYESFEYPAYHNQWRTRRRIKKKYYEKVLSDERKGDFSLDVYLREKQKLVLQALDAKF